MSATKQNGIDDNQAQQAPPSAVDLVSSRKVGRMEWIAFAGLMTAVGIVGIDVSVVTTTTATIVRELNGLDLVYWLFTAYLLTLTVSLPISGKLSDLYGRKRLLLIGIIVFVAGSMISGLAQTFEQLIVFRAIQGIGAGLITSLAVATASLIFPPEHRGKVQGGNFAAISIGAAISPALGSYIVQVTTWRWIFYINLPVGIIAVGLIFFALKEPIVATVRRVVDYKGMILLPSWVVLLVLGFTRGGSNYSWLSWQILSLIGGGSALLALFLYVEARSINPLIPLSLIKQRTIASGLAAVFLRNGVFIAFALYMPLFVQESLGGSVGDARNAVYSFVLPLMAGTLLGGMLINRLSYRTIVFPGLALGSVALFLFTSITTAISQYDLWLYGALLGFGIGLTFATIVVAAQFSAPQKDIGTATSMVFFFAFLGGTVIPSLLGTLQVDSLSSNVAVIAQQAASGGAPQSIIALVSNVNAVGQVLTNPVLLSRIPQLLIAELRSAVASSIVEMMWASFFLLASAALISLTMTGSAAKQTKNAVVAARPNAAILEKRNPEKENWAIIDGANNHVSQFCK